MEYSFQSALPLIARFCIVTKATVEVAEAYWRIQRAMLSDTFSIFAKPRNSIVLPAKSMGIDCIRKEKVEELAASRSSRAAYLPLWAVSASVNTVPAGVLYQVAGGLPARLFSNPKMLATFWRVSVWQSAVPTSVSA